MPNDIHRALLRTYLQSSTHDPMPEDALEIYSAPWLGPIGQPAFYRQIAQMDLKYTNEIEPLYGRMDCPVTILWGQEDQWLPLKHGTALAEKLSNKACTIIPGAGHLVQEDQPEAIVAAILKQDRFQGKFK
jgi:pimeloyl-ACP methyl ester carboxylesterase